MVLAKFIKNVAGKTIFKFTYFEPFKEKKTQHVSKHKKWKKIQRGALWGPSPPPPNLLWIPCLLWDSQTSPKAEIQNPKTNKRTNKQTNTNQHIQALRLPHNTFK